MTDFNQAVLLGNLTRDPEYRMTPNGKSVASFSIATNRKWKTNEGQQQEDTQFHNIVTWGKLAEIANQILYKGRKALIVGRIQTRSWEGQDGVKRYTTEIVADHISALGTAKDGQQFQKPENTVGNEVKPKENNIKKDIDLKATDKKENKEEEINLDDIPF